MQKTNLTKNCDLPWTFLQVHGGGMMQCCAVANDMDMGDFILDHCQKTKRGEPSDVFNSPGMRDLRHGLLTGNLRPMCRRCFFRTDKLIPAAELRNRVKAIVGKRLPAGMDPDGIDLTRRYAYDEMAISFTNRCNLQCVYCTQSYLAKTNPYFKMDFPEEFALSTLDFFVSQGIRVLRSCVEGEPTFYKHWYNVFSEFHKKYPHVALRTTTNLCRKYSDAEIDLLANHAVLDVSVDTLDPKLYAKLRPPGRLELVLENLGRIMERVRKIGDSTKIVSLHAVVSDITWPTLPELIEYAFSNGMLPVLGNYEERPNARAYREQICRPLITMPMEEQVKARDVILRVKQEMDRRNLDSDVRVQGGLLYNLEKSVDCDFNRFQPYDANPLHASFHKRYPRGEKDMHLDIVYDHDNIAYNGVLFSRPGKTLRLEGFSAGQVVLREVSVYEPGCHSPKYNQAVLPGYRRQVSIENGILEYTPSFSENVGKVLLEVSEYWE